MDVSTLFFLIAVIVFAIAAFLERSLVTAGLAFFAAAFLVGRW